MYFSPMRHLWSFLQNATGRRQEKSNDRAVFARSLVRKCSSLASVLVFVTGHFDAAKPDFVWAKIPDPRLDRASGICRQ
ncbi:MAG: hypothetical protein LBE62_06470 [Azonexus sp.]|jgi:hypothetical protein|nr:hypothetical protein [Azonexus sp.]